MGQRVRRGEHDLQELFIAVIVGIQELARLDAFQAALNMTEYDWSEQASPGKTLAFFESWELPPGVSRALAFRGALVRGPCLDDDDDDDEQCPLSHLSFTPPELKFHGSYIYTYDYMILSTYVNINCIAP